MCQDIHNGTRRDASGEAAHPETGMPCGLTCATLERMLFAPKAYGASATAPRTYRVGHHPLPGLITAHSRGSTLLGSARSSEP